MLPSHNIYMPYLYLSFPKVDPEKSPHHGPNQLHQCEGVCIPGTHSLPGAWVLLVCDLSSCVYNNHFGKCTHCHHNHLWVSPPHTHVLSVTKQISPGYCFFLYHCPQVPGGSSIREKDHLLQWLFGTDLFLPLCWRSRYFFPLCDGLWQVPCNS